MESLTEKIAKHRKKSYYFTCGQSHLHVLDNGEIWDKDSCIEVMASSEENARDFVFGKFGNKWGTSYCNYDEIKAYISNGIVAKITFTE